MGSSLDKIISGCIANKRRYQEELYKMYFSKMIAMCLRYTSDQDTAMMVVNDGFLKVFKNIQNFENRGSFEGWVRRIIFTSLSDYFRKENKYLKFMIFEEPEKKSDETILERLFYDDLILLINRLSGNTHKVFSLYAIEGFNHREIAEKLCISEGTSKWHLSEARRKLKEIIKESKATLNHAG
ncbi:RNA polymerase sigma factor [Portibacter lacus]|uniref:DNA-directed RNA polymerase sigma-70 factor n=1 Tax=Portibacter lacus TaxID=1099794 RepID=A0AA37SUN5_9BACT|nr:RNA polymerase sigma factor [Portibacter lacus]GLR20094.1 DNA-directed RNA polymerase sigma-70 factor [Portibacter lacus]